MERQAGSAIVWHILVLQQVNESAGDLDLLHGVRRWGLSGGLLCYNLQSGH